MAQITQNETQGSKGIKSSLSLNSAARRVLDPIDAGYAHQKKAEAFGATTKAVASAGLVFAKLNEGRERVIAGKIKKQMNENHIQVMTDLAKELPKTSIENFDPEQIAFDWHNRHSEDFKVGPNDAEGKPSHLIKDKALDEYDLPSSQAEELRNHYRQLEGDVQNWLLSEMPNIQSDKEDFYLAEHMSDGIAKIRNILLDKNSHAGELSGVWYTDPEGNLTQEGKDKVDPLTGKTPYENTLTMDAERKIDDIIVAYDNEIFNRMKTGTLSLEKALSFQRQFTEKMLEQQFIIDHVRSPNETFLKITRGGGYYKSRSVKMGTGDAQKSITSTIHLPPNVTNAFVTSMTDKLNREHAQKLSDRKQEEINNKINTLIPLTRTPDFYANPDNTMGTVLEKFKQTGTNESHARDLAWAWEKTNVLADAEINKGIADTIFQSVVAKKIADPTAFEAEFGERREGILYSRNPKEIKNALIQNISQFFDKDEMGLDMDENEEAVFDRVKQIMVYKDKKTGKTRRTVDYTDAINMVSQGMIQEVLNNVEIEKKGWEKSYYVEQLNGQVKSEGGKAYIQDQFLRFNKDKQEWVLRDKNDEKSSIYNHPYRKHFKNDEELGAVVQKLANVMNEEIRNNNKGKKYKSPLKMQIERQKHFTAMLHELSRQRTSAFLDQLQMKDPYSGEEGAIKSSDDRVPLITQYFVKAADAMGLELEQIEDPENELLTPEQRSNYIRLQDQFTQLERSFHFGKHENGIKAPHLREIVKENSELRHGLTYKLVDAVNASLNGRINALHPSNATTTFYKQCGGADATNITECMAKNYSDFGINKDHPDFELVPKDVQEEVSAVMRLIDYYDIEKVPDGNTPQ